MVNKMKSVMVSGAPCWLKSRVGLASGCEPRRRAGVLSSPDKEVIYVSRRAPPPPPPGGALPRRPHSAYAASTATATATKYSESQSPEAGIEEPEDVIDLGAPPRRLFRRASEGLPGQRRRRGLTPNPRLYPGPKPKPQPRPRPTESKRAHRGKRKLRSIPNSRLYRPGPPRLPPSPPPPARPHPHWPPPLPASASLDTASNVVLRSLRCLPESPPPPPECVPSPPTHSPRKQTARKRSPYKRTPGRRLPSLPLPTPPSLTPEPSNQHALVVTLPSAHAPRYHYQPASEHFRARQSATGFSYSPPPAALPRPHPANMEAASAEDRSEGNETLSAPSEFLAEFLSAILRRQYAEALKYCRLILQYEPHNATAQSFYPLLRQKLRSGSPPSASPALSPSPVHSPSPPARSLPTLDSDEEPPPPAAPPDHMDRGSSSEDDDQSDLELDSSQGSSPSLSFSHHTNRTEYSTTGSVAGSSGGAGGGWESSGSVGERSDSAPPDDNGNPAPSRLTLCARPRLTADDLENDNASAGGEPHQNLKSDSVSSLRRLRAQFACSIK